MSLLVPASHCMIPWDPAAQCAQSAHKQPARLMTTRGAGDAGDERPGPLARL